MKKLTHQALLLIYFLMITVALQAQSDQKSSGNKFRYQTDVALPVKNYGQVYNVPFAADLPDSTLQYKIIFEASMEKIDTASKLYEPLDVIARLYNLHVYGGVPQKNLEVVLVIGGFGIPVVMKNEAYRKKFGVDNPNLKILEEINAAGIRIICCAQAMMKHHIDPSEVNPIITPIFSRLTSVSTYQMKGYAYFRF
jgi:intracellular sulfur oxidation DsrE/DsrF family protein